MIDPTKAAIAQYWSAVAPTYDGRVGHGLRSHDERAAWQGVLQAFLPPPPGTVLDVGMGTGFLMRLLVDLGYTVAGLDLAVGMVRTAHDTWSGPSLAPVLLADAEALPFMSGYFDAVVSRFLLWTLSDHERAIGEWMRVCRPGAVILGIDGLWWQRDWGFRMRRAAGYLLEKWHDRHLPKDTRPEFESYYSPTVQRALPLLAQPDHVSIRALFQYGGLTRVEIHRLTAVAHAERAVLPLRRRLMYQEKFAVVGITPV
jgi:ubiquinone/menaquinone biosynthesis C-methylase UbiE